MKKIYVLSYISGYTGGRAFWDVVKLKKDALNFLSCNQDAIEPLVEVYVKKGEIKKGENK